MYDEHSRSLGKGGAGRWHSMTVFMEEVGLQLSPEVQGRETKDDGKLEVLGCSFLRQFYHFAGIFTQRSYNFL